MTKRTYEILGMVLWVIFVHLIAPDIPGWIANFKEIMDEPKTRIYRPRQIYVGPALNHYVPMDERG